jgi:hypothetical protein
MGGPSSVHADLVGCRSDPAIVLSNGVTLDLSATISGSADDVQKVAYTVHVPAGTGVVAVIGTSGILGPKEQVQVVADGQAATYSSTTLVTTQTPGVAVTADMLGLLVLNAPTASASGHAGEKLGLQIGS